MASDYNSAQAFKVARHFEYKNGVNIETITADKDLSYKDSQYQVITNNKGSSATIKVPPVQMGLCSGLKTMLPQVMPLLFKMQTVTRLSVVVDLQQEKQHA